MLADAVGEVNGEATKALNDLVHVNVTTSSCNDGLESEGDNIYGDVLDIISALVSRVCAESAAIGFSCGTLLPANRPVATVACFARRVAKKTAHLQAFSADQRLACPTAI